MVIVILGILAATALPKFVDMGKDARVAAVEGLKGAIWAAASIGQAKCAVSSTCDVGKVYSATPKSYISVGSDNILTDYGWPAAQDLWGYKSIPTLLNLSGFTVKPYATDRYGVFTKDGAPTPDNCSVTYSLLGMGAGGSPTITTTTTGC